MFGYIVINKPEMKFKDFDIYQSYYCGLCRTINDNYGLYICEYGYLHDYRKINFKELEKEAKNNKIYNNIQELIEDMEDYE